MPTSLGKDPDYKPLRAVCPVCYSRYKLRGEATCDECAKPASRADLIDRKRQRDIAIDEAVARINNGEI